MEEIWKMSKMFPAYEASNLGNIRSICRKKIKKQKIDKNGYKRVTIYNPKTMKMTSKLVHQIVCDAFYGAKESQIQVNHKDKNRSNNNIENLEYCSCAKNVIHSKNIKKFGAEKNGKKYRSRIIINKKHINLGRFDNEEDAKNAYIKKFFEHYNEYPV